MDEVCVNVKFCKKYFMSKILINNLLVKKWMYYKITLKIKNVYNHNRRWKSII